MAFALLLGGVALTCDECVTIQEGIHRTIVHNISALERKALAGTSTEATIEIGQLIWRLCESTTWKERRHSQAQGSVWPGKFRSNTYGTLHVYPQMSNRDMTQASKTLHAPF